MRLLIAASAVLLGACNAAPKPYTLPDGRQGHIIECSGTMDSFSSCYATARKVCKGDYDVVRQTEYARGPKPIRTLEVACKA